MSYAKLIEMFAKSADNCGIGPKGFERGNECAKGSGTRKASTSDKQSKTPKTVEKSSKSATLDKSGKTVEKSTKSASLDKSKKKTGPSLPGTSSSSRSEELSKGYPVRKITESPKFKAQTGSIMKGEVPPKPQNLSERALKALAAFKPVTNEMKAQAEVQEKRISDAVGGDWTGNRVPTDLTFEHNGKTYGVEVKTEFNNEKGILTIDANAAKRKVDWSLKNDSRIDIVVIENSTGKVFYKRGVGSFSIKGMYEVKDLKELKSLITEKNEDKIPQAARINKDTIYYKSMFDPVTMANLEAKATLARIAKNLRKQKSRDKQKAAKLAAQGQS